MTVHVSDFSSASADSAPGIDRITSDWYKAASLADIVATVDTIPFPPNHVPEAVADGSVSKVVFARICQQNPRIAVRYADGRLVKRTENGNGLDFFLVPKLDATELHVYHLDENGEWIRDAYDVDSVGNAKFSAYVTQKDEGRYYADLDLAIAHGNMEEPKFSDYVGHVPPAVHDPIAKV